MRQRPASVGSFALQGLLVMGLTGPFTGIKLQAKVKAATVTLSYHFWLMLAGCCKRIFPLGKRPLEKGTNKGKNLTEREENKVLRKGP